MFRKIICRSIFAASSLLFASSVYCNQKYDTYIWGNGYYQARPDALLQFQNFYPKKITNLPDNLSQLYFSQYYEAGIDNKGQLYIWEKHRLDSNIDSNQQDFSRKGVKMIQKDVKSVRFTSGYIWTLDKNGRVYQFPIHKKFDNNGEILEKQIGEIREVQPLRGSIQIEAGRDHVITLNNQGEVYAMGDDMYGQCGQADTDRNTYPPFVQKRIKFPVKVKNLSEITQIAAGSDHNLAVDKMGNLYGWGSNSTIQLSHEDEFSRMKNPLICSYNPLRITKNLQYCNIKKIAAGEQFSVVACQNRESGSSQVYTFGNNLKGQLGINQIKHLNDVEKVEKLSNYVIKQKGKQKKVTVEKLQCGKNHCIALLNIGYVMQWGDNQYGQLGNRKRSSSLVPIIIKDFFDKKVVGVYAGQYNTGAIVENIEEKK